MQRIDFKTIRTTPFQGVVGHEHLPRLSELLAVPCALNVDIHCAQDGDGLYIATHLDYVPTLICQCCLESFEHPIHSQSRYRPVYTVEAARELNETDEPVLYENGNINVINMLEDEAMLALPTIPKCLACEKNKTTTSPSQFAILATSN